MKHRKLISLLLAALLATTGLTACGSDAPTTTTVATTETPSVNPPKDTHLHLEEPVVYPAEFDFSDPESIERLFDLCREIDGMRVTVEPRQKQIRMRAKVNGEDFRLTIGLSKAAGLTSPEQVITCAKLFWNCYPQMYARFATKSTPTDIILNIENEGYGIAHASGNVVHIHDEWLHNNPQDFDCLTHEFAHIMQSGWDGDYCPSFGDDTYMIERFADYCRFLYAYKNGYHNDMCWSLQTMDSENTYYKSVRFWVWVDCTYSTADADIMVRINQAVQKKIYPQSDWEPGGKAWDAIFEGTNAKGKDLNTLWDEFVASGVGRLESKPREQGSLSALLRHTNFRAAARNRYPDAHNYWKIKY